MTAFPTYKSRPKFDRLREYIMQKCYPSDTMHMVSSPPNTERVRVAAYICKDKEVQMVHDLGYTDLDHVFVMRPRNCQYSVLELACGAVLLVDMFELNTMTYGGAHKPRVRMTLPDTAMDTFPSVDAAIMYAVTVHE